LICRRGRRGRRTAVVDVDSEVVLFVEALLSLGRRGGRGL
jgi:hypothetical protein